MKRFEMIYKVGILIVIIIIMTMVFNISKVYSSSFSFSVTASKTKLKPGESTIVSMKISNIEDKNNLGINALESVLEYDSNVLEVVTQSDMTGKNNWTITYNEKGKNFLVNNIVAGIKEAQEIGEIKFKVKDNVSKTKTIIKFKNIKSNDGNFLMLENDKQIELIIGEDEEKNKNEIDIIETSGNSIGQIKDNISMVSIPKAGKDIKILFVVSMLWLLAILLYIRYKNIDK